MCKKKHHPQKSGAKSILAKDRNQGSDKPYSFVISELQARFNKEDLNIIDIFPCYVYWLFPPSRNKLICSLLSHQGNSWDPSDRCSSSGGSQISHQFVRQHASEKWFLCQYSYLYSSYSYENGMELKSPPTEDSDFFMMTKKHRTGSFLIISESSG